MGEMKNAHKILVRKPERTKKYSYPSTTP